ARLALGASRRYMPEHHRSPALRVSDCLQRSPVAAFRVRCRWLAVREAGRNRLAPLACLKLDFLPAVGDSRKDSPTDKADAGVPLHRQASRDVVGTEQPLSEGHL